MTEVSKIEEYREPGEGKMARKPKNRPTIDD